MKRVICIALLLLFLVIPRRTAVAQNYTPKAPQCETNQPGAFGEPTGDCGSLGDVTDTAAFVLPCANQNRDESTCVGDAAVFVQGMPGQTARNRVYRQGNYIIQESNEKHLVYQIRNGNIYFIQDTTWANVESCNEGGNAFQRIYSDAAHTQLGALTLNKSMSCGKATTASAFNQAFSYNGDDESLRANPAGGASACTNKNVGNVSGSRQLIFHGNASCGSFTGEIMSIYNSAGAGKGEVYMYCKGQGLCGWYQNIDFSKNQPATWEGKDVCAGFGLNKQACPVMCQAGQYNKVEVIPLEIAIQTILSGGTQYVKSLEPLKPAVPAHKATDMDYKLDRVVDGMKPYQVEIRKPEQQQYSAPASSDKIVVLENANNLRIDTRATLHVNGEGVDTTTSTTTLESTDDLQNAKDDAKLRKNNDNLKILSSLTGRGKIDEFNAPGGGHDISIPSERLEEQIVPCDSSIVDDVRKNSNANTGQNAFTISSTGTGGGNIVINFLSSFIAGIFNVVAGFDSARAAEYAKSTLGIDVRICSCTNITGDEQITENTVNHNQSLLPKQVIDKKIKTAKDHGVATNEYDSPLGGKITIDNTQTGMNKNQVSTDTMICSTLPRGTLVYADRCGDGKPTNTVRNSPLESQNPPGAVAGDPSALIAGLPSNFISLTLSDSQRAHLMQQIQVLIDTYVKTGAWPGSQLGNPAYQDKIREFAQKNNVNEAFLYALWIEETHASSVGQYPFGCDGWEMKDFDKSLDCVVNDTYTSQYMRKPLDEALCRYADGHYPCDFAAHPNFVPNLTAYIKMLYKPQ